VTRFLTACILALASLATAAPVQIPPTHPSIRLLGRTLATDSTTLQWAWSGSGAAIAFTGTSCSVRLQAQGGMFRVVVDGVERPGLDLRSSSDTLHVLASGLAAGTHFVELRQKTEAQNCTSRFRGFRIDGAPATLPAASDRRIEFYGNSITCGYGILDSVASHPFAVLTEDEGRTFAAQAADALGAERRTVCWSGKGVVQNFGRDTVNPTLPKLHRQILPFDTQHLWNFAQWIPQVVVIDLGTNDFSSVAPDPVRFRAVYSALVDSLHASYPEARFVLVDGPMLSDGYPSGLNALTTVKGHLDAVVATATSHGIKATHLSLTPQSDARGYGADWHPNLAQATLNGQELTNHLRTTMGWTGTNVARRDEPVPAPRVIGRSIRIPEGEDARARLLDLEGRTLWSSTLEGGSTTVLPRQSTPSLLEIRSERRTDRFPIPSL